jgi:hypothetical protein
LKNISPALSHTSDHYLDGLTGDITGTAWRRGEAPARGTSKSRRWPYYRRCQAPSPPSPQLPPPELDSEDKEHQGAQEESGTYSRTPWRQHQLLSLHLKPRLLKPAPLLGHLRSASPPR